MRIIRDNRLSRLSICLSAAHQFLLTAEQAMEIIEYQLRQIGEHWSELLVEASLSDTDRTLMATRQFLNPYAFEALPGAAAALATLGAEVRDALERA